LLAGWSVDRMVGWLVCLLAWMPLSIDDRSLLDNLTSTLYR
jgi:hypothetical protein